MLVKNDLRPIGGFNVAETTKAPLRLAKSTWLRATPTAIFNVVPDHAELGQLFPWIHKVTIDTSKAPDGGVGTRRCCDFGDGLVLEEVIVAWKPPQMYAFAS